MFLVNDDLSIYATRGDIVCLNVSAIDDRTGEPYEFQPGDILQMKVYVKKDAENVVLQKDFPVPAKTNTVGVFLTEQDTKIGDVISKPTDYWYEVTLNPYTNPQTFIGYDEDGAKIFKLFPEGNDVEDDEPVKPEDIPVVDEDLSLVSSRPVENKAIARAITLLKNDLTMVDERLTGKIKAIQKSGETVAEEMAVERARIDNLVASPTPGDSELVDIRVGADGDTYASAGTAVRSQMELMEGELDSFSTVNERVNLFNKNNVVLYARMDTNGVIGNPNPDVLADYWCSYQYIPVDDALEYHTNIDTTIRIAQYDENKGFISVDNYTNTGMTTPFVPDSGCKYIRIQGYASQLDILVFCLASCEVEKGVYISYARTRTLNAVSGLRKKIEIIDTGDIADFYSAMLEAYMTGECDVYIHPGEYIYTNELIEEIRGKDGYNRGIPVGNGCRYFFDTDAKLICRYTGANADDVASMFSPLDSANTAGSWEIYNLTLEAVGTLYAIHDEASGQAKPYRRVYENCYCSLDSTGVGSDINKCIGGGAGSFGEVIIRDCYFKTVNPLSSRCPDVSYHGSSSGQNMKIVVTGCYFENGFECHSANGDGIMRLLFSNNSLKKGAGNPVSKEDGKWVIRAWNNDTRE